MMGRTSTGPAAGRETRAAFRFVFASALMSAISFSIVIPILPNLVREIAGGDTATAAEWVMLFASAWGFAQFICAPLLGALSDRFGRRPVLLISTFGLGVDFLFMAFAPTLPLLLIGRVISGATAASFATAHAYVADIVPREERAAAFGRLVDQPRLSDRARAGRLARRDRPQAALSGGGPRHPRQLALRLFRAAGIAAERTPRRAARASLADQRRRAGPAQVAPASGATRRN
jgi:hypothetical protein